MQNRKVQETAAIQAARGPVTGTAVQEPGMVPPMQALCKRGARLLKERAVPMFPVQPPGINRPPPLVQSSGINAEARPAACLAHWAADRPLACEQTSDHPGYAPCMRVPAGKRQHKEATTERPCTNAGAQLAACLALWAVGGPLACKQIPGQPKLCCMWVQAGVVQPNSSNRWMLLPQKRLRLRRDTVV